MDQRYVFVVPMYLLTQLCSDFLEKGSIWLVICLMFKAVMQQQLKGN